MTAQSLHVYSEFTRIDPFGKIVAADKPRLPGLRPREILSPALARGAYASFHVVVTVPAGKEFTLYVGQNPENSFTVTMDREHYSRRGNSWIPDTLERVKLPYTAALPDKLRPIRGQSTVSFWMDLWTPAKLRRARYKVEPQIYFEDRWITYPMEVRVVAPVIPRPAAPAAGVAPLEESADATARGALLRYLCETPPATPPARTRTVRRLILRNALQDMALAAALEKEHGKKFLLSPLLDLVGATDPDAWCRRPVFPTDRGPEWYLKIRDTLYRMVD